MLFQELASQMGYEIASIQSSFPDAIVKDEQGKEYRVEFEYRSGNFVQHGHDPSRCDLVICWIKDEELSVNTISLKDYLLDLEVRHAKRIYKTKSCLETFIEIIVLLGLFFMVFESNSLFMKSFMIILVQLQSIVMFSHYFDHRRMFREFERIWRSDE